MSSLRSARRHGRSRTHLTACFMVSSLVLDTCRDLARRQRLREQRSGDARRNPSSPQAATKLGRVSGRKARKPLLFREPAPQPRRSGAAADNVFVTVARRDLRFRFNAHREVELNAHDLRNLGHPAIKILAEADRSSSEILHTAGDDDGWLSPADVEAAPGLHLSMCQGYQSLVDSVANTKEEGVIPANRIYRIWTAPFRR